jgi:hypothetical protein
LYHRSYQNTSIVHCTSFAEIIVALKSSIDGTFDGTFIGSVSTIIEQKKARLYALMQIGIRTGL